MCIKAVLQAEHPQNINRLSFQLFKRSDLVDSRDKNNAEDGGSSCEPDAEHKESVDTALNKTGGKGGNQPAFLDYNQFLRTACKGPLQKEHYRKGKVDNTTCPYIGHATTREGAKALPAVINKEEGTKAGFGVKECENGDNEMVVRASCEPQHEDGLEGAYRISEEDIKGLSSVKRDGEQEGSDDNSSDSDSWDKRRRRRRRRSTRRHGALSEPSGAVRDLRRTRSKSTRNGLGYVDTKRAIHVDSTISQQVPCCD